MYRSTRMPAGQERRGVILLVVITLLTLFAVVGLTFVYYAEAEATASRIFREAQDGNPDGGKFTGLPTETVFSWSLGQIIYPVPDNAMGVYTSIRGHDLSRKIYGWNSDTTVRGLNQTPFNGVGRMYGTVNHPTQPTITGLDDHFLVNYQYFRDLDPNFLRDPERPGSRPDLATPPRQWVGGNHAPYTYPDLNNLYLAAVKPDNTVMVPSYHRPWLFGALDDPANPNWTNAAGKYLTLRPRRIDNDPSFPMPGDAGGDVKNLVGGPGGNDSIWIDLGYPVQTYTDGAGRVHYYKPLFAILVRDLDSLINVNVHGNILGANNTHASHQGWGKWEINPSKILNDTTVADEWNRIFRGNGTIAGRYGNNNVPGGAVPPGTPPPAQPVTPFTPGHSQINYNGTTDSAPVAPGQMFDLPGQNGHSATTSFPRYNVVGGTPIDRGYGNSSPFEVTNHPSLFDYFRPNPVFPPAGYDGHDRVFDVSEIRKLNCYAPGSFSDLNTSELARLCPNNLNPSTTNPALLRAALQRRHLITTHSFDLDSPGVSPMVWDPNVANAAQRYELAAGSLFPVGDALAFPTTFGPPPADSEFGPDWRSLSAMLPRVDLNRPLRNYPPLTAGGTLDLTTDPNAYPNAQADRHTLARDIFIRLCWATGTPCTYNPDGSPRTPAPTYASPQMGDAARWLAQLAVNIVDFIDNDDFLTPFKWNPTVVQAGTTPPDIDAYERNAVVYGNELNRVVLNEVYVEYKNDPMDPLTGGMATTDYHVRVWAELHNPLPDNQVLYDGGVAQFSVGAGAFNPYQLLITKPNTALRAPNNVRGEPDPAPGQVWTTLNTWTGHPPLSPSGGATANPATQPPTYFSLIGPKSLVNGADEPFPGTDPAPPVPHMYATEMAYKSPLRDGMGNVVEPEPPTLLLRRLACPYLPPQPDPSQAAYNPYITVDYADMKVNDPDPMLQRGQINRAITHTAAGAVMGGMEATTPQARASWGRRQPYAAHISMRARQNTTYGGQPQQTFGSATGTVAAVNTPTANGPGSPSFDWLVFRDRPLISGSELLDVPAVKPHELSQQFIVDLNNNATLDAGEKFLHRADWRNPRARIYRALEWLTTHDRAAGMNFGGRIAGRININTIYEQEVFRAWADSQSNRFTPAEVDQAWNLLVAQRTPRLNQAANQITPRDRPFRGLAAPFVTPLAPAGQPTPYPNTPEFTVLAADTSTSQADTMLSDSFKLNGMPHPNLENELLTKILGNATTRSNTFAVWITVGYFEVTDINSRPVKLGAEFRPQGGSVVRQRGFAVVDRTGLSLFNDGTTSTVPDEMTKCAQVTATGLQTVPIQALQGPAGTTWQIQPGTLLRLRDSYFGGEEVVTVLSVDNTAAPPTFTAYFGRTHTVPPGPPAPPALPISVAILGNPGPQPTFSYTNTYKYGHVVPHFMLLN